MGRRTDGSPAHTTCKTLDRRRMAGSRLRFWRPTRRGRGRVAASWPSCTHCRRRKANRPLRCTGGRRLRGAGPLVLSPLRRWRGPGASASGPFLSSGNVSMAPPRRVSTPAGRTGDDRRSGARRARSGRRRCRLVTAARTSKDGDGDTGEVGAGPRLSSQRRERPTAGARCDCIAHRQGRCGRRGGHAHDESELPALLGSPQVHTTVLTGRDDGAAHTGCYGENRVASSLAT